jgi:hypothetical protein
MHDRNTARVRAVYHEEGSLAGGIDFYWTRGGSIVIYQGWEIREGCMVYGPVLPDPMVGEDLADYFAQNWAYKGDRTYRVESVVKFS